MKTVQVIRRHTLQLAGMTVEQIKAAAEQARIESQIPNGAPTLSFVQAEIQQSLSKDPEVLAAMDTYLGHWVDLEERSLIEAGCSISRADLMRVFLSHGVCPGLLITHEGEGDAAVAVYRLQKAYSLAKGGGFLSICTALENRRATMVGDSEQPASCSM